MESTGNTVLITGSTSGIGLGLAERLHAAGHHVIVAGRRRELLEQIVAEHPGMASVELDVTDPDSIASALEVVADQHPTLDVLINNAGVMHPEDLLDPAHVATAEAIVATNLLGPIRVTAAFLPLLRTQASATIVNVSSGLAFVPLPITPTYDATKAAVHSFTESLRVQLAATAVQVVELVPPAVQTTLLNQQDDPNAMPLAEFLDEVMALLAADPSADEILVERVKPLRFAVANGTYPEVLAALSSAPPAN